MVTLGDAAAVGCLSPPPPLLPPARAMAPAVTPITAIADAPISRVLRRLSGPLLSGPEGGGPSSSGGCGADCCGADGGGAWNPAAERCGAPGSEAGKKPVSAGGTRSSGGRRPRAAGRRVPPPGPAPSPALLVFRPRPPKARSRRSRPRPP
ncbi:hypothetical protein ACFQ9X_44710 [Catenulispora yoronensis]